MTPLTARDIVAATMEKRLSVTALAREIIERIEATDATIGAWHYFDPVRLAAEARRLDTAPRYGPLHGLPIAIKDVIDTADMPTAYGSALYEGNRPRSDASCVALLRDAGALIVGKTVSTEFAFKAPGKTTHPSDPTRTPGGSSSGSAAAVAAGMVPVALGTQTSGSTIRPAAFCGIVGYKPSFGLIDRSGIKVLADSLDTIGLFARTVGDIAMVSAYLSGRPEIGHLTAATAPRFAVFRTPCWHLAESGAQHCFEQSLVSLARAGADLQEIEDPGDFTALLSAHETIMHWEVPRALAFERLAAAHALQASTREGIAVVPGLTADAYDAACACAAAEARLWAEVLGGFDALVTLPARGEAPVGLASTGDPIFNRAWTQLRLPCVTVPAGTGAAGLPLGLQLVGAKGADASVLATAMMAEAALTLRPWPG